MSVRRLLVAIAVLFSLAQARFARALDCPCTWEHVICEADAVAEIEMHLATKTTPDRMEVRRVIWNRTKHGIRAPYGLTHIPHLTQTREGLLNAYSNARRQLPRGAPMPEWMTRFRRALDRGSYRSIIFVESTPYGWYGGGVAYIGHENWLDHPRHAEWWAKIQPYLQERIEADKRGEKPAFCARGRREDSQLSL
jgi:hypothetical protein